MLIDPAGGTNVYSPFRLNRRWFLSHYAGGLGSLALAHLIGGQSHAADSSTAPVDLPRGFGKARSVICLFQHGGPSQVDLFDPKAELTAHHGKPYPAGEIEAHFDKQKG